MLDKLSEMLGLPHEVVFVLVVLLVGSVAEYVIRNICLNIPYFQKKRIHCLEKRLMDEAKRQVV